jgi:sec-independent protein translocase protein TatA
MLKGFSITEVVIILIILVVVFGSKKIIELARGAGETTKELKNIKKDYEKAVKEVTYMEPADTKPEKGGD